MKISRVFRAYPAMMLLMLLMLLTISLAACSIGRRQLQRPLRISPRDQRPAAAQILST